MSTERLWGEPCEGCDDTGYEIGSDPPAFCTMCNRGFAVAIQNPLLPESEEK